MVMLAFSIDRGHEQYGRYLVQLSLREALVSVMAEKLPLSEI